MTLYDPTLAVVRRKGTYRIKNRPGKIPGGGQNRNALLKNYKSPPGEFCARNDLPHPKSFTTGAYPLDIPNRPGMPKPEEAVSAPGAGT